MIQRWKVTITKGITLISVFNILEFLTKYKTISQICQSCISWFHDFSVKFVKVVISVWSVTICYFQELELKLKTGSVKTDKTVLEIILLIIFFSDKPSVIILTVSLNYQILFFYWLKSRTSRFAATIGNSWILLENHCIDLQFIQLSW